MVCAAVGQSARLYDAGLTALAFAVEEVGNALDVLNRGYGPGAGCCSYSSGCSPARAVRRCLRQQVEDALAVCAAFNDRLADAFGFGCSAPGFEAGASTCSSGYR